MSRLKKICVILFALSLSFAASAFANESNTDTDMLAAFGIIEDDFSQKEYITRADMVKYAVRMYNGADNVISGCRTPFSDVTEETENADYIGTAYTMGFVNGTSEDKFSPTEPASLEQAAKIMVNIAGYGEIIKLSGGSFEKYFSQAVKLGFFKGVELDSKGRITPNAASKLFANVLKADAAEFTAAGGSYEYTAKKNLTVLEKNLKIYKSRGVVEADSFVSIYGGNATGDNYVEIDGVLYLKGTSYAENYLGQNTEFYYSSEKSGENEILFITPSNGRNSVIEVDAADIEIPEKYKFNYYTNDKTKLNTKRFTKSTVCIVNKKQTVLTNEALMPSIGKVTLIDNDSDGVLDVIIVNKYDLIIVGGAADGEEPVLTDRKTGKNILKDAEEFFVFKNGKSASLSDIREKDVVLAMEAQKDSLQKYVYIYASDETVTGVLEEIADDYVTISGKRYRTHLNADTSKLGCSGEFRLDFYGVIENYSYATDRVYGFVKICEKTSIGKINVKIFTENDRFVILELADKVKHNARPYKKNDFYTDVLASYVGMVTYRVNEEGNITEMNTPQAVAPWTAEHTAARENDVFRISYELTDKKECYREAIGAIGEHIVYGYLDDETKVFSVPSLDQNSDDEDFAILTKSNFYNDEKLACNISIYDTDDFNNMGACMLVGYTQTVNAGGDPALITNIKTATLAGGDECFEITCTVAGNERKYYTCDTDVVLPKKGSIVLFRFDPKGFVSGADTKYDSAGGFEQYGYSDGPYSQKAVFKGKILTASASEKKFAVDFHFSQGPAVFSNILNPVICTYSVTEKTVKAGSEADLVPGRYCFVKASNLRAMAVIVFTE